MGTSHMGGLKEVSRFLSNVVSRWKEKCSKGFFGARRRHPFLSSNYWHSATIFRRTLKNGIVAAWDGSNGNTLRQRLRQQTLPASTATPSRLLETAKSAFVAKAVNLSYKARGWYERVCVSVSVRPAFARGSCMESVKRVVSVKLQVSTNSACGERKARPQPRDGRLTHTLYVCHSSYLT